MEASRFRKPIFQEVSAQRDASIASNSHDVLSSVRRDRPSNWRNRLLGASIAAPAMAALITFGHTNANVHEEQKITLTGCVFDVAGTNGGYECTPNITTPSTAPITTPQNVQQQNQANAKNVQTIAVAATIGFGVIVFSSAAIMKIRLSMPRKRAKGPVYTSTPMTPEQIREQETRQKADRERYEAERKAQSEKDYRAYKTGLAQENYGTGHGM